MGYGNPSIWILCSCNFMNFRRNKECRECGALCNDQSRSDENWGRKKASSWGSSSPRNATLSDMGEGRSGNKHQQSKLGPSRKLLEDADDDLEEDADVIFQRDNGDDGSGLAKSFKMSQRGTKFKSDVSKDNEPLSDLDFSDLDDTPTNKKKGKQNHATKNKKIKEDEDEDDDEDDDEDMDGDAGDEDDGEEDEDRKQKQKI